MLRSMNQMLGSMAIQDKINFSTKTSKFTRKSLFLKSHLLFSPPTSSSSALQIHLPAHLKIVSSNSKLKLSTSASNPILSEEETPKIKEKLGVVVKPMEKARIVLKVIWMEKTIGVALDQVIPGLGTIPLTPYYFWGREDAQDQLKVLLESKPWISRKQIHILLNQAAHILNLWPQSG